MNNEQKAQSLTSASLEQSGLLAEVPVRIQRSRQHKQVSPNGLPIVYVGRGTRWGNPFRLCKLNNGKFAVSHECDYQLHQITKKVGCDNKHYNTREEAAKDAIRCYSNWLLPYTHEGTLDEFFQSKAVLEDALLSLKNKNLSCWCKLDETCHADYLINLVAGIR